MDQAYAAMFILWYYVLCIFLLYSSILIHLIFKHYKSLDNPWDFVLQITVCLKLRVEINYAPWSGLYLKKKLDKKQKQKEFVFFTILT